MIHSERKKNRCRVVERGEEAIEFEVQKERIGGSLDLVTSDFSVQYEKARSFEVELGLVWSLKERRGHFLKTHG